MTCECALERDFDAMGNNGVGARLKIRHIWLGYLVVRPTCVLLISTCTCSANDHKCMNLAVIIMYEVMEKLYYLVTCIFSKNLSSWK